MLILQEAAHAAAAAGQAGHGSFEPVLPWLIVLLPLLGFVLNGALSVLAARRALPVLPPVGDPSYDHHEPAAAHAPALATVGAATPADVIPLGGGNSPSEQEHHDHGTDAHPVDAAHAVDSHDAHHGAHDDHGHDAHDHAPAGPKPFTHVLPSFIAPGVLLAAFAVAVANFLRMRAAMPHEPWVHSYWQWMPVGQLQIGAAMQLDQLSMLMTLIITGVGSLIHIFSIGYMKEDPGYPRYMAYLNLFVFFMLTLVLGASYPVMFVGWEGVGLCSYLLIGFWFSEKANADAGKKAFIVNRIGDFGFLIAMFLLFWNVGALDFATVSRSLVDGSAGVPFAGAVITAIALFFFLGAAGKSAQIPLYIWLPDAMAGPTPVSALIHAATMVTAGVYLVARSNAIYAMAPAAALVVALVGALTGFFAATIGLKQWDIKKVLAYSTVSQLGFMFAGVGMGAYVAGVFHLMTHAFFKACLFLGSGAVIHAMHAALHATHNPADAQDMRNMGGLRKHLPVTFATMGIATLAIAGVPPFAGFFSKDEILGAAWLGAHGESALSGASLFGVSGRVWMAIIWGTLTLAALMTAFYMGRMMIYTFFGTNRTGAEEQKHLHEGSWTLTLPLIVLAAASVLGGFLNVEEGVPVVQDMNWLGFGPALERWLEPVIEPSQQVLATNLPNLPKPEHTAVPILIAIAVGLGGLALAWALVGARRDKVRDAEHEPAYDGPGERLLYNKWYVDEAYDRAVVKPVGGLSRLFARFDMGVIDWTVDLFGRLSQLIGMGFGRLQTGQLNTYAFALLVGVLIVLGAFVAR